MREELEEKHVMIESLRDLAKVRKPGKEGRRRELGEVTKRRQYGVCVQEGFCGFALDPYSRVLQYASLEIDGRGLMEKAWLGAGKTAVKLWEKVERGACL